MLNNLALRYALLEKNIWANLENQGYGLSSSQMCVLADKWEHLHSGDKVLCVGGGINAARGYAYIEA